MSFSGVAMRQQIFPDFSISRGRLRRVLIIPGLLLVFFCLQITSRAATLTVPAGGDLQAAINAAQPGDTVILQAGASYTGGFRLPNKVGDAYITIRTSTPDTELPEGRRVTPADSSRMAKIVTPGSGMPAISTEPGAHHYRLIGLEIMPASASAVVYEVVSLGSAGADQDTLEKVPHHIAIDRCFIHGWPNANFKRGIGLNSAHTEILNSHVSDFHSDFQDSQAIGGFNGPGPFRIINNRLEGAAENIMFGGAVPSIPGLVPSNVEIRRNHLYKPLSWKPGEPGSTGYRPWIKNLFEIKNGQDFVIDGNVMENNWYQADQHGTAIVLTPRSEWGAAPWAVVQRITFTNNRIANVGGGVLIMGKDDGVPNDVETNDITFRNNLFQNVRNDYSVDGSRVIQVHGTNRVTFDHNTILHANNLLRGWGALTGGFVYTNNITHYGGVNAGVWTDCGMNQAGLNCHFPGNTFTRNAIIGARSGTFASTNFYPADEGGVGFVDYAAGDYRLGATSPYKNAGTDGKDLGADIDAIETAYQPTEPSATPTPTPMSTPTPTPTPTPAPTPAPNAAPAVSLTSPAGGASFVTASDIMMMAAASDVDGNIVKVEFFQGSTKLGDGIAVGNGNYSFTWGGVAPGAYTLTAKATDDAGATATSGAVNVTVQSSADFSISASPSARNIKRGAKTTYIVTATPSGGFTGVITFDVIGSLPDGVSYSYSPQSIASSGSSTLTVRTSSTTPVGTYVLTVRGTSGSLQHTTSVTLSVRK